LAVRVYGWFPRTAGKPRSDPGPALKTLNDLPDDDSIVRATSSAFHEVNAAGTISVLEERAVFLVGCRHGAILQGFKQATLRCE
jgi:hypothetical protein